jgi:hypothetical protein
MPDTFLLGSCLVSGVAAPLIVIGFVGGFVSHDSRVHSAVQVAEHLRRDYGSAVYSEAFENRRREQARMEILQRLGSAEERRNARIVIYGHSWGASETVTLARELGKDGIPVLLTIQVDSVAKIGQEDSLIPANVGEAVNFYQPNGIIHGRRAIRAADATRTQIIGNFRFDYHKSPIRCGQYPLRARIFMKSHIQIECDPAVWDQVESLIRAKLLPPE